MYIKKKETFKLFVSSYNLKSIQKFIKLYSEFYKQEFRNVFLPRKKKRFVFLRSPHVNNKSKEIFYLIRYRRLLIFDKIPKQLNNILQKAPNDLCIKVFLKS